MLSNLTDDLLTEIFKYLTEKEIFELEKASGEEYRLTNFFWEKRSPIAKIESCILEYYDIVKRFNKNRVCFHCNQHLSFGYVFLINHGYRDDIYHLECYHKKCINPIKKQNEKLGLYISPISGLKLMGIVSVGV